MVLVENSSCPHEICQVGLWYIVRSGCSGEMRLDPVNGDKKVWFLECQACAMRGGRTPGAGAEDAGDSKNQSVSTLPEWF